MIVMNRKRISIMLLIILTGIFTFAYKAESKTQQTSSEPISNRVVILDAGHRQTRWRGRK